MIKLRVCKADGVPMTIGLPQLGIKKGTFNCLGLVNPLLGRTSRAPELNNYFLFVRLFRFITRKGHFNILTVKYWYQLIEKLHA